MTIVAKEYCELAGRSEVNMIDLLFSLIERKFTKEEIVSYIHESKIKYPFAKQNFIGRIYATEERERNTLVKKINLNNLTKSDAIPENIYQAIPMSLRIFPRDFALKETEIKVDLTEENKKTRVALKNLEKKSLEDIISSTNYHDFSKKHTKRKASVDITNLFSEIVKTENINLGKKFKPLLESEKDIQNLRKETMEHNNMQMDIVMDKNNYLESDINDKNNFIEESN
jgi:hypothetical protein